MAHGRDEERATVTLLGGEGRAVAVQIPEFSLEVLRGAPEDVGKRHEGQRRSVLIGSHPSADLALSDPYVSRLHARLEVEEGAFWLTDVGSRNGTRVGGVRIRQACLEDGSLIDLGSTRLRFSLATGSFEIPLSEEDRFEGLIGRSVAMRELFGLLERVAPSDAPVLIEGETGTGKELLARAIHARSSRRSGPFVVLDCGAVAPSLIESAIFGVDKGAFTGAARAREGVMERAHGGTLFLDELGELRLDLQPRLLRAAESGEVTRLGATKPTRVDVRLVAATHRDVERMVARGEFRDDLYYRLAVLRLRLPPLRQRREDIPLLASHFARQILGDDLAHLPGAGLEVVLEKLRDHDFPGNVRELRNLVERALLLADPGALRAGAEEAGQEIGRVVQGSARKAVSWRMARKEHDRAYLLDLLERTGGDLAQAAEVAELHPKSLERLLRQHGLRGGGGSGQS